MQGFQAIRLNWLWNYPDSLFVGTKTVVILTTNPEPMDLPLCQ
jgi:hypothetical protein